MAALFPFRALRPRPGDAAKIAAVPYDVVSAEEARALAAGTPLSFLRVSRAEIELPPGEDSYANAVYERAALNFSRLREKALVVEASPALYMYRLTMGDHAQLGLAGCFSLEEYDRNVIRKHERTRPDKEDDRTRHMLALRAQTGPVFLIYRASVDVSDVARHVIDHDPLFDFTAEDGVRHTLWTAAAADRDGLVQAFSRVESLYIADGHHRAASAARVRRELADSERPRAGGSPVADFDTMLAVAFPHDQVQVLAYHRVVKDLGGRTPEQFIAAVQARFAVVPGGAAPERRGAMAMYLAGRWYSICPRVLPDMSSNLVGSLDVSVLQDQLLAPVLGIVDVGTDRRIDFVGGVRGTHELERLVDSGRAAAAFSMYPVDVAELMAVADLGAIMPPKSTWFEPKLRDGLLIHLI
jgi:uncharacterized protein (DUF1015 family)